MKPYLLSIAFIILAIACSREKHTILHGLWKIERVEIMKGPVLQKTIIDSSNQYWSIRDREWLYIFDDHKLQNRLQVKMDKESIRSFDTSSGNLQEEFLIERSTTEKLELVSHQTIDKDNYDIIYYLDKIEDSKAPAISSALD